MCMWQSQALAGTLSFGGAVPDENGICCASAVSGSADAAAAMAVTDAPLSNVRRAIMIVLPIDAGFSGAIIGASAWPQQRHRLPSCERMTCGRVGVQQPRPGERTMTGRILVAATAFAAFVLTAGPAAAQTLDKIKSRGVLVVGTKADYRPFGFRDTSGAIVGFEPD